MQSSAARNPHWTGPGGVFFKFLARCQHHITLNRVMAFIRIVYYEKFAKALVLKPCFYILLLPLNLSYQHGKQTASPCSSQDIASRRAGVTTQPSQVHQKLKRNKNVADQDGVSIFLGSIPSAHSVLAILYKHIIL